mmetsp:Transcript_17732/g.49493  ORF Transcript_17732/g.49493 Transcript_17732/m.49493 type:complete len:237 (-) Transcript_17732:564-1274(-)
MLHQVEALQPSQPYGLLISQRQKSLGRPHHRREQQQQQVVRVGESSQQRAQACLRAQGLHCCNYDHWCFCGACCCGCAHSCSCGAPNDVRSAFCCCPCGCWQPALQACCGDGGSQRNVSGHAHACSQATPHRPPTVRRLSRCWHAAGSPCGRPEIRPNAQWLASSFAMECLRLLQAPPQSSRHCSLHCLTPRGPHNRYSARAAAAESGSCLLGREGDPDHLQPCLLVLMEHQLGLE